MSYFENLRILKVVKWKGTYFEDRLQFNISNNFLKFDFIESSNIIQLFPQFVMQDAECYANLKCD